MFQRTETKHIANKLDFGCNEWGFETEETNGGRTDNRSTATVHRLDLTDSTHRMQRKHLKRIQMSKLYGKLKQCFVLSSQCGAQTKEEVEEAKRNNED